METIKTEHYVAHKHGNRYYIYGENGNMGFIGDTDLSLKFHCDYDRYTELTTLIEQCKNKLK